MYRAILLILMLYACSLPNNNNEIYHFTQADKDFLAKFSLNTLPDLPLAPDNSVADNLAAAQLGQKIFFDKRLSKNGEISCANCHQPEKYFTDGMAQSQALGTTMRSAPSVLFSPWSPWQFWDGRKDSLWSQALGPIEHPDEQGISRTEFVQLLKRFYLNEYQQIFGNLTFSLPDVNASPLGDKTTQENWNSLPQETQNNINRMFSNAGKALMAYQRKLKMPNSKFDKFINALNQDSTIQLRSILNNNEVRGLRLFMGSANCASCHNGPLFTNFEFHNVGAPEVNKKQVDMGRYNGVSSLTKDEFTCLSQWSDANTERCEEMLFLKQKGPELVGAFKTPGLRNIAATAPYMQAGQFTTLKQVLAHYNTPKPPYYDRDQHPNRPHFDIMPLQLTEIDIQHIIAFLNTLTSPIPKDDPWWKSPSN